MRKELELKIPKRENRYYQDNPAYFDELLELAQDHYKTFVAVLMAKGRKKDGYNWKYEYLVSWINSQLPRLADPFYKLNTKIYWILNGLTDFPVCANCGKTIERVNVKITCGYPTYCCNRCQVTSAEFRRDRVATWERKYGPGATSPSKSAAVREKQKATCRKNHGVDHPMQSDAVRAKSYRAKKLKYGDGYYFDKDAARQTRLEKNGGPWFTEEQLERRKKTCMEKYGTEAAVCSNIIKQQVKANCIKKYGVASPNQLESVKEKKRQSFSEHYGEGITSYAQTQEFKDKYKNSEYSDAVQRKIRHTCLLKYGTSFYTQTDEYKRKNYETRKKNHTFKSSALENTVYEKLKIVFPDLKRQYKSNLYPFSCDFYSPCMDLYIEYNGTWTHGGHWFDSSDSADLAKLAKWKAKNTKYYDNAIMTWTDLDVRKRKAAAENEIRYLVFWDMDEVCLYVDEFLSNFAPKSSK